MIHFLKTSAELLTVLLPYVLKIIKKIKLSLLAFMIILLSIGISCISCIKISSLISSINLLEERIDLISEPGLQYERTFEMKKTLRAYRQICNDNNFYILLHCKPNNFICKMNLGSFPVNKDTINVSDEFHEYYNFQNIIHFFKIKDDNKVVCSKIFSRSELSAIDIMGPMLISYLPNHVSNIKFCLSTDSNYGIIMGLSNKSQQKCTDVEDISWFKETILVLLNNHKKLIQQ